jgi:hypothetical protein
MKNTVVQVLFIVSFLSPVAAFAQAGKTAPTTATYIMKEDIDKVGATEQSQRTRDENVKVIDLGYENFAVGIVHRASTRTPPPPAPAGGGGGAAEPMWLVPWPLADGTMNWSLPGGSTSRQRFGRRTNRR